MAGILPLAKSTDQGSIKVSSWMLPGHGEAYSDCGSLLKFRPVGCLNVEDHGDPVQLTLAGQGDPRSGKVFIQLKKRTCLRAECPVCYEKWAGKGAGKIAYRLGYGGFLRKVVHVIVSPPERDWELSYEKLRARAYTILKRVGVKGGSMIFHPFRQHYFTKSWYFSPHFHVLGFGWIKDIHWSYKQNGWIIRNLGLRKSVGATALYQLSHAGVHKKFHTITWFGSCSYNKLKIPKKVFPKKVCPGCKAELVELVWVGEGEPPLPDKEGGYWVDPAGWIKKGSSVFNPDLYESDYDQLYEKYRALYGFPSKSSVFD